MKGGQKTIRSIVVAGELGSFLEAAEAMGERLAGFMGAYRRLVHRYLHSRPLFSKFLGDRFVYVYEVGSPSFARNVLHSTMSLEGAFREALSGTLSGFNGVTSQAAHLSSLNIGVSEGALFRIDGGHGLPDDLIGLPLLAARNLAGDAAQVRSHILVDEELSVDRVARQWLHGDGDAGEFGSIPDGDSVTAHIVTPESMLREYRNDRDRYRIVNAVEAFKEEIDQVAQADVFSFRLGRGERPHVELVLNPLNIRGAVDKTIPTSILLVHVAPATLVFYPELIVPTDRVYTVQLPIPAVTDYRIVLGLAIQAPESDLIDDELTKIQEPDGIVDCIEALRGLFKRARENDRLSLAYYRF
jgi:hypothetical protein